jgi:predicted RNase H-like HicB family nuclease
MKKAYPVIFTPAAEGGFTSYMPDFDINSQGDDLAEAIEMARDAMGIMGIDMEDEGKSLPEASESVAHKPGDVVSFVDVDFTEYRRQNDMRTVRRNVSLPSWLNAEADKAGLNVSAVLQNALRRELGVG